MPQIGPQILDINVYERFLQNLQIQMRRASGVMIFYYEFIIPVIIPKLIQFLKNFFFGGGGYGYAYFYFILPLYRCQAARLPYCAKEAAAHSGHQHVTQRL